MHYSIIPAELVFADLKEMDIKEYQEITYENKQFIVEAVDNNQMKIVQLLSSDPNDFLNSGYCPGSVIKLSPELMDK